MNDFAVVSEGVTDQAVLHRILLTYFKTPDFEPGVVFEQPRLDATGEAQWRGHGTWLNVFRYLEDKLYREAFQTSRYLVVQIDSDCSEMEGYGVLQSVDGRSATVTELVEAVARRFCEIIGAADLADYEGRFIFAVCVCEMECWLLPLWTSGEGAARTANCLFALNRALAREGRPTINPDKKDVRRYREAALGYKKRATLLEEGRKNESLRLFLDRCSACEVPSGVVGI